MWIFLVLLAALIYGLVTTKLLVSLVALGVLYLLVTLLIFVKWGFSGNAIFDDPEVDFTDRYGVYRGTLLDILWWIFNIPLWPIALTVKVLIGLILGR